MSTPPSTPCPSADYVHGDGLPAVFFEKNRLFNPDQHPEYANDLGLPDLLYTEDEKLGIAHLHVGSNVEQVDAEKVHEEEANIKQVKCKHGDGVNCADKETLFLSVVSRTMHGHVVAACWFGRKSPYNEIRRASTNLAVDELLTTTINGFTSIMKICEDMPAIKKVYIMTSSEELIEAVTNLFLWTKDGFPDTLPGGMSSVLLGDFRDHLQNFDHVGLEVKFWKVRPEHVTRPTFFAEKALFKFFKIPYNRTEATCPCGGCISRKQVIEMEFAKFGRACCDADYGKEVAHRYGHLKMGDSFSLINNAGVTNATVVMRVDGQGLQYRHNG